MADPSVLWFTKVILLTLTFDVINSLSIWAMYQDQSACEIWKLYDKNSEDNE